MEEIFGTLGRVGRAFFLHHYIIGLNEQFSKTPCIFLEEIQKFVPEIPHLTKDLPLHKEDRKQILF